MYQREREGSKTQGCWSRKQLLNFPLSQVPFAAGLPGDSSARGTLWPRGWGGSQRAPTLSKVCKPCLPSPQVSSGLGRLVLSPKAFACIPMSHPAPEPWCEAARGAQGTSPGRSHQAHPLRLAPLSWEEILECLCGCASSGHSLAVISLPRD